MFILGTDLETTGLEIGDHRIIEVFVGLYDETGKLLREGVQRIDPQRSIAADAQRVHGISAADLIGKPVWQTVAPKLLPWFQKADIIVGHNLIGFDHPFLTYEFKRVGLKMPTDKTLIDTMIKGTWATPDGKMPSLAELCFAGGVHYDTTKAHAADYDVKVMMEAFFNAVKWGFIKLEEQASLAA